MKTQLQIANALGDDRNLNEHGSYRKYWYSIGDGFRLLIAIRKDKLIYVKNDGDQYPTKVVGEEYSSTRENKKGVLITDPYYIDNFETQLIDDIRTITNAHDYDEYGIDQKTKNNPWSLMPKLIIIPLLSTF